MFPLLATGLAALLRGGQISKGRGKALMLLILATVVCLWLPVQLLLKGLVWLIGVLVWWISGRMRGLTSIRTILNLVGPCLFLGSLVGSRLGTPWGSDFIVGIAFGLWMVVLIGPWKGWMKLLKPIGRGLSEVSYTLYVTHFPLLFFFSAVVLQGEQVEPGWKGFTLFVVLNLACLVVAIAFWYLFEKRTSQLRRWIGMKRPMR